MSESYGVVVNSENVVPNCFPRHPMREKSYCLDINNQYFNDDFVVVIANSKFFVALAT
jgi:hypothetical protein